MGSSVRRVGSLALWAAAMFVGRQLAGVVHEVGHAVVGLALGWRVDSMQPWPGRSAAIGMLERGGFPTSRRL